MNKNDWEFVRIIGLVLVIGGLFIGCCVYIGKLNDTIAVQDCMMDCDNEGFTFEQFINSNNNNLERCWCNNPTDGHPVEIPVR